MFMMDPNILARHSLDDEDEGEDFDLTREVDEDDVHVKVHEIKFDAYGIMDDGLDDTTDAQLAKESGAAGGAAAAVAVDEDLFDDEDLDDLEDELDNLEVQPFTSVGLLSLIVMRFVTTTSRKIF